MVFIVLLFSCNTTDPAETTLADQIKGNFIGILSNSDSTANDFNVIVTEINDTRVTIAPASGSYWATFEVNLTSATGGIIALKAPADIIENNGTFAVSTGQLSYTYHLGGSDEYNFEIFLGTKQ